MRNRSNLHLSLACLSLAIILFGAFGVHSDAVLIAGLALLIVVVIISNGGIPRERQP